MGQATVDYGSVDPIFTNQTKYIYKSIFKIEEKNKAELDEKNLILKSPPLRVVDDYRHCSLHLKDDEELTMRCVSLDGTCLKWSSDSMKKNENVVLAAVRNNGHSLKFASKELQSNRYIVKEAVKTCGVAISFSDNFKFDSELMSIACKQNPASICCISEEEMNNNRGYILNLTKHCGRILQYLPKSGFRDNMEIVLSAISNDAMCLEFVSEELKFDKKVVEEALKKNGMSLVHCIPKYKNSMTHVLMAVQNNGLALQHASPLVRKQRSIVLEAIKQNGLALIYAEEFLNDKEIVLCAVKEYGLALKYASKYLRDDEEVVMVAIKSDPQSLLYAGYEQKSNRDVVMEAVKRNGMTIYHTHTEYIREDRKIALEAVSNAGMSLDVFKKFQNDFEICMTAVKQNGLALGFCKSPVDYKICFEAIKNDGMAFKYLPESLQNDDDLALKAVKGKGMSIKFMLKENFFRWDEILVESIRNDSSVLDTILYLHLKSNQEMIWISKKYHKTIREIKILNDLTIKFE
jgi:hypothetical protein